MNTHCLKWAAWAACFTSFIAACSQGELSPIEPPDTSENIQTDGIKTEPDTIKANPDTVKTSPDTSKVNPDTAMAVPDTATAEPDTLKRDTLYIRDTVTIYKDTVDRVNEVAGNSYTAFLSKNPSGKIDTVVRFSEYLTCDMGDESFTCSYAVPIRDITIRHYEIKHIDLEVVSQDTETSFIYVTDTLYKDTLYRDSFKPINDTTFLNYGDNRQTDYIPPKYIYEPGEHPIDSTAIRDFFDTLDLRDAQLGGKNKLTVNSQLTFNGFPLLDQGDFISDSRIVEVLHKVDGPAIDFIAETTWPSKRTAGTNTYFFSKNALFESDTTITWTLGYTHYESGMMEKDSIQVTTFLKVE